ncbi:MAG: hypothetical protein V3T42_09885, partial [Nitrospirales bacterium]
LSLLWANLMGGPVRLMPLPVAFEWAKNHQELSKQTWKGFDLLNTALEQLGQFLHQTVASQPQKKRGE